jgi:prephenate dehydratase
MKTIAIQGYHGCFHEIATRNFYNNDEIQVMQCKNFPELFKNLNNNSVDYATVAIENTVAGSIIPNYSLLNSSAAKIIGEIYLRISQNLITHKEVDIHEIEEVHSHFMAIEQCRVFLQKYPHIKIVETEDTALSVKNIKEKNQKNAAAISSLLSAKIYDMKVEAEEIETNKINFTRFLILSNNETELVKPELINKSSLSFSLPHEAGSLASVLSIFSFYKMNLVKIQSLPILGEDWKYRFYVDLTFDDYDKYKKSVEAIKPLTTSFSILGEYGIGEKTFEKTDNN